MKKHLPFLCCLIAAFAIFSVPVISSLHKNSGTISKNPGNAATDSSIETEPEIPEEFACLSGKHIVIDPGHGGPDPGKVGINQALEKDINLSISLKLKTLLESYYASVAITRSEDRSLADESASHAKQSDLTNRIKIINDARTDIAISIHQNSFQQESSHGAQVFYHTSSEQGKLLADSLQTALISVDPENHRCAKANDSYYLLKKSTCPLVIVECGFLSNQAEAEKLCTDAYQDALSNAIVSGIAAYFKTGTTAAAN